jgi:hypothetical protein
MDHESNGNSYGGWIPLPLPDRTEPWFFQMLGPFPPGCR